MNDYKINFEKAFNKDIPVNMDMYLSPIQEIFKEIDQRITEERENLIYSAVQEVGIQVDKDELLRALSYDRNQYVKGYTAAILTVREHIDATLHLDEQGQVLLGLHPYEKI